MVQRLIGFAVIPTFRCVGLENRIGIGPILRKADASVGIGPVVIVKKLIILGEFSQVPAKIQIIAAQVRYGDQWAVRSQHKDMSHGGWAGLIETVAQIIEQTVIFQ